jgi:phage tail sheath protein FI
MPYKQSENALAGGAIASGETLTVTYTYADPTKVASADVIGTTDGSGHRTGLQAFLDCFQMFGFFPKRLIAPVYSPLASVTAALIAMANRIRGRAYIDAPVGLTPAQAIAGRGPAGEINFNVSGNRAVLFYPYVKAPDATGAARLEPMSQHAAGLGNAVDIAEGYWVSMSNHELAGITGLERRISAMVNDPTTEANALNEAGIVTVFNA